MALSNAQRRALVAAFKSGRRSGSSSGGYGPDGKQPYMRDPLSGGNEAERRWGSRNPKPSRNGAAQAKPIPNTRKPKPRPIPNAKPIRTTGKYT